MNCEETVPQILKAFFELTLFEEASRNSISIGSDSDTIAAIKGSIAGAFYVVPKKLCEKAKNTFLMIEY